MTSVKFHWIFLGVVLVVGLVAVAAQAGGPPEAKVVVDKIKSGETVEHVDYSVLGVKYDDAQNVLYYAVADGGHFEHTVNLIYRVPIAEIADVTVVDNSDQTVKGGAQQAIETADGGTSEGDWARVPQGCTIKLVSKGPKFAWAELTGDQVKDGKLTVDPAAIKTEPVDYANLGYFKCGHARELQHDLQQLKKQVKKGM
ncbi:MAG: hypothetical protein WBG67_20015 [Thermoanaerobaculia bacterium]